MKYLKTGAEFVFVVTGLFVICAMYNLRDFADKHCKWLSRFTKRRRAE